jgi:hypothetical protein
VPVHGLLVESVDLRSFGGSAGGNDVLGESFDGFQVAPGEKEIGPLRARDLNNRGQVAGFTLAPTELDPLAGARGFLLAKGIKGPYTPIDVPGAPRNVVSGLNDRGQLVGAYENTNATPSPQAPGMQPLGLMRQGDLAAVVSDSPEDL